MARTHAGSLGALGRALIFTPCAPGKDRIAARALTGLPEDGERLVAGLLVPRVGDLVPGAFVGDRGAGLAGERVPGAVGDAAGLAGDLGFAAGALPGRTGVFPCAGGLADCGTEGLRPPACEGCPGFAVCTPGGFIAGGGV